MQVATVPRFVIVAFGLILVCSLAVPARAQDAPPALGAVVGEDTLTGPVIVRPVACPTGRSATQLSPEGLKLVVTGWCTQDAATAGITQQLSDLVVPDGDVQVEIRPLSRPDRAVFELGIRVQENGDDAYLAHLNPAQGLARLLVIAGGQMTVLAERTDLAAAFPADGWTTLALRAQGPNLWMLLNGEPVLSATDSAHNAGHARISLVRSGSLDDQAETAVVVRNLRLSALAASDPSRSPTLSGLPALGAVVAEDTLLASPAMVATGTCPTGRAMAEQAGEGIVFKVRGTCVDAAPSAVAQTELRGLTIPDGEFRLEVKPTAGVGRSAMVIFARVRPNQQDNYYFSLDFGTGRAIIGRNAAGQPQGTILAARDDTRHLFRQDDWTSLGARMVGTRLWLFLNDEPVLSVVDATYDTGSVRLRLFRTGNANDEEESAVVLRNVRVSAVADGDPARAPTYAR